MSAASVLSKEREVIAKLVALLECLPESEESGITRAIEFELRTLPAGGQRLSLLRKLLIKQYSFCVQNSTFKEPLHNYRIALLHDLRGLRVAIELYCMAEAGHIDPAALSTLLKAYPQYRDLPGPHGRTFLYFAIFHGNLEIIKFLIDECNCSVRAFSSSSLYEVNDLQPSHEVRAFLQLRGAALPPLPSVALPELQISRRSDLSSLSMKSPLAAPSSIVTSLRRSQPAAPLPQAMTQPLAHSQESVLCGVCRFLRSREDSFCRQCGAPSKPFCSQCGYQQKSHIHRFCTQCTASIQPSTPIVEYRQLQAKLGLLELRLAAAIDLLSQGYPCITKEEIEDSVKTQGFVSTACAIEARLPCELLRQQHGRVSISSHGAHVSLEFAPGSQSRALLYYPRGGRGRYHFSIQLLELPTKCVLYLGWATAEDSKSLQYLCASDHSAARLSSINLPFRGRSEEISILIDFGAAMVVFSIGQQEYIYRDPQIAYTAPMYPVLLAESIAGGTGLVKAVLTRKPSAQQVPSIDEL